MKNYYSILGVSPTAHAADIKRTYRKLALQYHPDRNPDPQAEQFFKEINEAYDVVGDTQKRYEYDQQLLNPMDETSVVSPPTHRDPRYRPHARTQTKKPSAEQQLMQRAVPYLTYVAWAGIFVVLVMVADFALPSQIERTFVVGFKSTRIRYTSQEHLITMDGARYRITDEARLALNIGDTVEFVHSAFLHRLVRLQAKNIYITNLATVYSNYVFVPMVLAILSILGVVIKNKVEFLFNVGIVNIFVLVITLILLLT
jgi:hypothetical protein